MTAITFVSLAACAALMPIAAPAAASVYSDDLTRYLVAKTSDGDKTKLVQWVFVNMSASPAVAGLAKISPEARNGFDREMATITERLLETDCRPQTVAAVKYDGVEALKTSFGFLGQAAMKLLIDDPAVGQSFGRFSQYLDQAKLGSVFAEAGVTRKPPAAQK